MQIYAPAFSEERLLQAAHAYEQASLAAQTN
jgi:Asp-tRNA(Asn)/Glu-tRNA(Gln) amidotransferase A subunit family amidase